MCCCCTATFADKAHTGQISFVDLAVCRALASTAGCSQCGCMATIMSAALLQATACCCGTTRLLWSVVAVLSLSAEGFFCCWPGAKGGVCVSMSNGCEPTYHLFITCYSRDIQQSAPKGSRTRVGSRVLHGWSVVFAVGAACRARVPCVPFHS